MPTGYASAFDPLLSTPGFAVAFAMAGLVEETTFRYLQLNTGLDQLTGHALTDNGTNLNGTPSDLASGAMSVPLLGGKSIASLILPDPDDAAVVWGSRALLDGTPWRRPVSGDKMWATELRIDFPDGLPVVGDNVAFGFALFNESTPLGATVDGLVITIEFSAVNVNPRVRFHIMTNGTITSANGAATAGISGVATTMRRSLTGAGILGSLQSSLVVNAIDVNGVAMAGGVTTSASIASIGTGSWYLQPFMYRTLALDLDNIVVTPRYGYACGTQKTV